MKDQAILATRRSCGKLDFPAQIVVDVAIFFVLHGYKADEVLSAQFLHHLWNV